MRCILFFSFMILLSSAFECPSKNWFRFRNKCYLSDRSKFVSFQENVDFCESLNATTLSIHSEEENNFIQSKLIVLFPYWLGIRQVDFDAKTYAWLDGTLYNYSNWNVRLGEKSCAGAFIEDGKWFENTNCKDTNYALCQIDFDSPFYKMQSQMNQLRQDLKNDRKAEESRFNETNERLDKALNRTHDWITNLNSTFEGKLNEKKESSTQSINLYWIFGILVLSMFCALILPMYKIVERVRWLTNEIKSSNVRMLQREPLTGNLDLKDED